ncbi:MAG: MFS transporter [Burkholderiales bacterium]|nr:MFS transporter [Burkholderiales bacterium]
MPVASVVRMTKPRATLATCSGAHILHDGLTDVLYVLLPVIAQTFGLNYAQIGFLRSANKAALALFQLPAGLAAERYGERSLLVLGTACAGVGFVALGFASGFAAILLALFLAGLGSAFQHPLSSSMISTAYPVDGRRIALGTYNFAGDVGKVGVAGLFTVLIAAGMGWQAPAVATGVVALAAAGVVYALLRSVGVGERPLRVRSSTAPQRDGGWGLSNREGFAALTLIEVVDSSMRSAFLTFVAFLMLAKGLPEGWALMSVPLVAAGGMAGKLACGFLAERFGPVRTIAVTQATCAAGIVALVFLPGLSAYLLLPLVGLALNGTSSALYGTVGDVVEAEKVSRAFGLFYTVGSSCGVIAPLAYGVLADQVGIETTVLAIAGVTTVFLPATLWLKRSLAGKPGPAFG